MSDAQTGKPGIGGYGSLAVFVILIVGLGSLAGFYAGGGDSNPWFQTLVKPVIEPPGIAFGIVWPILYSLMSVAVWRIWRTPKSKQRSFALRLFLVQLLMNFAWSFIFFKAHQIAIAAIWIALLIVVVLITMRAFFALDKPAMWLLTPYFAWISFAFILNLSFWVLNPSQSGL